MLQIEGQLSLEDLFSCIFESEKNGNEHNILDSKNIVWDVRKAEIEKYVVNSSFSVEDGSVYYCAKNISYTVFGTEDLGKNVFRNYEDAKKAADCYIEKHREEIVLNQDLAYTEWEAYFYIRECDGREMISFLLYLNDGNIYVKDFYSYHHMFIITDNKKRNKVIKDFKNQLKAGRDEIIRKYTGKIPLKNLYKCKESSNWDFAEAKYSGCI